jgi:hypothetical protein
MSEELNENIEFQFSSVPIEFHFSPAEVERLNESRRILNQSLVDLFNKIDLSFPAPPAVVRSKWFYRCLAARNYFRGLWNALRNKPMWDEEDDYGY